MGVTVVRTRPARLTHIWPPRLARGPAPTRFRRLERPYWQERGWVRSGNVYTGTYQTPYGSFLGSVEDRGWNRYRFYLIDPPRALRQSTHWACFQPRGRKGFFVHMAERPADLSSGILAIERLITEAHE